MTFPVGLKPVALFKSVFVPAPRFQIVRLANVLSTTSFVTVNEEVAARLLVMKALVVGPGMPFLQLLVSSQFPPNVFVQEESTAKADGAWERPSTTTPTARYT